MRAELVSLYEKELIMERLFLGWDKSPLSLIVRHLINLGDSNTRDAINLADTAILLPAGRAGRRLLELLVDKCAQMNRALIPPRIMMPGTIVEGLYGGGAARLPDPMFERLSWCQALEGVAPEAAGQLAVATGTTMLPFVARWALAETLMALHRELNAQGLTCSIVSQRLALDEMVTQVPEVQRGWWQVLAEVSTHRDAILAEHGLLDRDGARWQILRGPVSTQFQNLIVACCPDLSEQAAAAIRAFPNPVTILIHAPASLAEGFRDVGTVDGEFWRTHPVSVSEHQLHILADPRQEALEVIGYLADIAPQVSIDSCTLAALSEESRRALHAQLKQADIPFFDAEAPPPPLGTLASWLRAATDFARTGGREEGWRLLRHPHSRGLAPTTEEALHCMLDTINESCVQSAIPLRGDPHIFPASAAVEAALERLIALLEPFQNSSPRPFREWLRPFAELFDGCNLTYHIDAATHRSLEALLELVHESPSLVPLTGSEALGLLSDAFSLVHTPETDSAPALDILGWLELHLDDAAHVAIAGMVEGAVPEVLNADPFLPNALRRELGLSSNESRMARDSYLLAALIASRDTHLFLHRHLPDGSQTLPSRLLYRGHPTETIERARCFFTAPTPRLRPAPSKIPAPSADSFIAAHEPTDEIPHQLTIPVTAIRLYNQCPYRFYLGHILKLERTSEPLNELDPRLFGILIHHAIQTLAEFPSSDLTHERRLHEFLVSAVDNAFSKLVGSHPSRAALLQRESARQRIDDFTIWQLRTATEGWYPFCTEFALDPAVTTELRAGRKITLTGRIDRIDRNEVTGHIRIVDFKTSDKAPTVWGKNNVWNDPQLPLYALLLLRHAIFCDISPDQISLCHLLIDGKGPASLSEPKLPEEGFLAVQELLDKVLDGIAHGIFWPPGASKTNDEYGPILGISFSNAE
jgi:ATP-dependent helicase/nuclease subunit B